MDPLRDSERLRFLAHIRFLAADGRGCSPSELVALLDMITDTTEELICLRLKLREVNEGWSSRGAARKKRRQS
jgi:hypothetical protein